MKKRDLKRCKIREIPSRSRKKLASGEELAWELSVPESLNGGKRLRLTFTTRKIAQVALDRKIAAILDQGTENQLSSEDTHLLKHIKAKTAEAKIPETEVLPLIDEVITRRQTSVNNNRVSDLFKFYNDHVTMGDGVTLGWLDDTKDAENIFITKCGDMLLRDVNKDHAQQLLMYPPDTERGERRFWSTSSRRKWRSNYSRVWNFGLRYWTDNQGISFVRWNPFENIWFGKVAGKRGLAAIHDDIPFLKEVYNRFGIHRPDLLPAWDLELKTGLRPMSELAGGRSQREKDYNNTKALTWGQVKLEGEKFGCGYVDTWCPKTEGDGVERRLIPLRTSSAHLLRLYKPFFKDSDPVLPCSAAAYYEQLSRIFYEVGLDLYGKPQTISGGKGDRDKRRHTAISAWYNETDERGNNKNSQTEVVKWAGHVTAAMLLARYHGAMTGQTANAILNLGMEDDWQPRFFKATTADVWDREEAIMARAWGRRLATRKRKAAQAQTLILDVASGSPPPHSIFDPATIHALKQEKHGLINNQETSGPEIPS
jgi:hypothetical protein